FFPLQNRPFSYLDISSMNPSPGNPLGPFPPFWNPMGALQPAQFGFICPGNFVLPPGSAISPSHLGWGQGTSSGSLPSWGPILPPGPTMLGGEWRVGEQSPDVLSSWSSSAAHSSRSTADSSHNLVCI